MDQKDLWRRSADSSDSLPYPISHHRYRSYIYQVFYAQEPYAKYPAKRDLSIPVPVWIRSISRLWHFVIHTLKTLYTLIAKSLSFGKKHTFALRVVTCLGVIVFATKFVDQRFQIRDFIAQNSSKAYGTFYETHYANPPLQEIATQFANLQNPRNLIVIFAESMESTYSAKSAPIGIGGVIPMRPLAS